MNRKKAAFYLAMFAIASIGILLIWHPWPDKFHHHATIERIGEAALIAVILALTVDKFIKAQFLRETSHDVWTYIIGHPLPKEVQEFLKSLANIHLLRRDWQIKYTFTKATNPQKIKVRVEANFSLQNLSSVPQEYRQMTAVEEHDRHVIKKLACDSTEPKAAYKFEDTTTAALQKPDENDPGVMRARGKKIKIRPNLDNPDIRYQITSVHEFESPIEYSDVYSFAEPALFVTVTAEHPEVLEVFISRDKEGSPSTIASTESKWEFRRLFVRGDHIRVRWRPKR